MSFDVDIHMRRGDVRIAAAFRTGPGITVLFGPSGVGKTSTLAMIAGLLTPDSGHIRVGGRTLFSDHENLPPEQRRAGYVFQDARLFPHLKVDANLRYGGADGWEEIVDLLSLRPLLARWPRTLSGGEAKRVAIGRALLSGADFLLMDEPLASLDRARADGIMRLVEDVRDQRGIPILYVTHDRLEAERLATCVVDMERAV